MEYEQAARRSAAAQVAAKRVVGLLSDAALLTSFGIVGSVASGYRTRPAPVGTVACQGRLKGVRLSDGALVPRLYSVIVSLSICR